MKPHEVELRAEIARRREFVLVTASGDRIKVRSAEHIDLPPREDEDGRLLVDHQRSDFFRVWSDGRHSRLVAFAAINVIEVSEPTEN